MSTFRNALYTILLLFIAPMLLQSCVISNPEPEACELRVITVSGIEEGPSFDILISESGSTTYYINRGLEQGLTIETLRKELLNKKVTLHLPKVIYGTSRHIAQLAKDDTVIFTEFD